MTPADQLTVARASVVPVVVVLFTWHFSGHAYWATAIFIAAMATDQLDGIEFAGGRNSPTLITSLNATLSKP